MSTLRFILLGYAFTGLFVAGGVFFKKGGIANFMLACFIVLLSFEVFNFLYGTSVLVNLYPQFVSVYYFPVGFAYGPLLFIHFKALIHKEKSLRPMEALHFLPILIAFIEIWDILLLPGLERLTYYEIHFLDRIMPYNYIRAGHQLLYGVALVWVYVARQHLLNQKEKIYLLLVVVIYVLSTVLISWLTLFADNWRQFIYFYFLVNTTVFAIAYLLYTDTEFLKKLSKKYLSSSLNETDMKLIFEKVEHSLNQEKLYLDQSLSLINFSSRIGVKPHSISQTMSVLVGKNFNEYLNEYRVIHAKKLLKDASFDHYKIEAIALESGFNNKVTFNKYFLKNTGLTPSEYKRK